MNKKDSRSRRVLKDLALSTLIALSSYLIIFQVLFGFIEFNPKTITNETSVSFNEVIAQNSSNLVGDSHFRIKPFQKILEFKIKENTNYVSIDVNSLDKSEVEFLLSFRNSSNLEIAQDRLLLRQGTTTYKPPRIQGIDALVLNSNENFTITLGISGITGLKSFGPSKEALLYSVLVFIFTFLIRNPYRPRVLTEYLETKSKLIEEFKIFIRVNDKGFKSLLFVTVIGYAYFCIHFTLSLDEELRITSNDASSWIGYGRFGNFFLDRFATVDGSVIPFMTDFLAVTALLLAACLFSFLFAKIELIKKAVNLRIVIFGGLFITFPYVVGDYMAFSIYNLWLGFGYISVAASAILLICFLQKKNTLDFIFSAALLSFAISIYQSFISLFLTVIACLMFGISSEHRKKLLKHSFILLLVSTLIYFAINRFLQEMFVPAYGYISSLVGWQNGLSVRKNISIVFDNFLDISSGKFDKSGVVLFISNAIFLVYVLKSTFLRNTNSSRYIKFTLAGFLVLSPFALTFAIGGPLPARSLVALPVYLGVIWWIVLKDFTLSKYLSVVPIALLILQLQWLNFLFYGDNLRYAQDENLGRSIIHRLETQGINYREYPIVFIGSHDFDSNDMISEINSGGRSFFDDPSQVYRMSFFLQALGYSITLPTPSETSKANETSKQMSSWPQADSIRIEEGVIIVKFGNNRP